MTRIASLIILLHQLSMPTAAQFRPLTEFVPMSFAILDSASGDLNQDGKKDFVLILRDMADTADGESLRPLLILEGNGKDAYRLAARNDSVVLCRTCGGVMGDPYQAMVIKNNYFTIEHYGGSGWRWTRQITFKYDRKTKAFLLHKDVGVSFHASAPDKQKESQYFPIDFDRLPFTSFSTEKVWRQ